MYLMPKVVFIHCASGTLKNREIIIDEADGILHVEMLLER
jgi:hypothetical protein